MTILINPDKNSITPIPNLSTLTEERTAPTITIAIFNPEENSRPPSQLHLIKQHLLKVAKSTNDTIAKIYSYVCALLERIFHNDRTNSVSRNSQTSPRQIELSPTNTSLSSLNLSEVPNLVTKYGQERMQDHICLAFTGRELRQLENLMQRYNLNSYNLSISERDEYLDYLRRIVALFSPSFHPSDANLLIAHVPFNNYLNILNRFGNEAAKTEAFHLDFLSEDEREIFDVLCAKLNEDQVLSEQEQQQYAMLYHRVWYAPSPLERSCTPGQPLGLLNPSLGNCCFNVILQLFALVPSYTDLALQLNQEHPLRVLVEAYKRAQQNQHLVLASATTQLLRTYLSSHTAISPDARQHEDAGDILLSLFRDIEAIPNLLPSNLSECTPRPPFFVTEIEQEDNAHLDVRNSSIIPLALPNNCQGEIAFEPLVNQYMLDVNSRGLQRTYLKAPPQELLFQLNRFSFDRSGGAYKINNAVIAPQRYTLPHYFIRTPREDVVYDCDFMIVHSGSIEFGHYVCCVKQNGQWFKMSDLYMERLNQQAVDAARENAYFLHYSRAETSSSDGIA